MLICSEGKTAPGRPPRARGGRGKGPRTGPSPPGTCAPMGPRPACARSKWELGSLARLFLLCSLTKCGFKEGVILNCEEAEDTAAGRKRIIAVVTDRVYVWQKGNCLAKETLLDKISKKVEKIKIKISNNFQKKGQTSLDFLTYFDTRSGPNVTKKFRLKNTCCRVHMSIKLGRQYTCIYDTLH